MRLRRWLPAVLTVALALVFASSAFAVTPEKVFLEGAEGVNCQVLSAANGEIRECNGTTHTFDGTRIDVNVFLPPESAGTGPYPAIGDFHGWGESKRGLKVVPLGEGESETKQKFVATRELPDPRIVGWALKGYAVFSMSDRGWGYSCGAFDPKKAEAECAKGYNHLMDDRYEVHDAQYLFGRLAAEGLVEPTKIGVTGASYGGGISLALAALRNRVMETDNTMVPWVSPAGQAMEIAAAVPQWPWSDLSSALAPNGRNLDYVTDSAYRGPSGTLPIGVWKASWSEGLYQAGYAISNYSTTDPQANIPGFITRLKAGDPYSDAGVNGIVQQLSTFHSSYGIDHSVEPSPLLIQSGWNDDLFPVDEALRYYERTRAQYQGDPISLYFADYGHSRSQNKPADEAAFNARLEAWFAHYLKGEGAAPASSVEAFTTTCPKSAASEGPFRASDWSDLQPGEINLKTSGARTITHGTNAEESQGTQSSGAFDPILGTKSPCTALPQSAVANPHAVTYDLGAAPTDGYTLMGSPTVIAKVESPSPNSQIAARLLDVSPEGTETLVARGLYRPTGGSQEMVFQLHPQAYRFAAGHVARLELLPSDYPYGRYSNLQNDVTLSDLEMRLPVTDQPGALGGLVQNPAAKVVPAGYTLANEFQTKSTGGGTTGGSSSSTPQKTTTPAPIKIGVGGVSGRFTANRKAVVVPVKCTGGGACSGQVLVRVKRPGGKGLVSFARGGYSLAQGASTQVRLPLTKAGRKVVAGLLGKRKAARKLSGIVQLNDAGRPPVTLKRPVKLAGGR